MIKPSATNAPSKPLREKCIAAFLMTCAGPAFSREDVRKEAEAIVAGHGCYAPDTVSETVSPINQCDGCQRGLPTRRSKHGTLMHDGPDSMPVMACTADRYAATPSATVTKQDRPSRFTFLLNAMESASQELSPSAHNYYEKRLAVLRYVEDLTAAVEALYFAAYWHPDRPVDERALWTAVRDAAGITPGQTGAILGPDRSESPSATLSPVNTEFVKNPDLGAQKTIDHAALDARDAARYRFRHSNYKDKDGYEYGYCKVRWKNGAVESMLWADDEEIDAAMAAADRGEEYVEGGRK